MIDITKYANKELFVRKKIASFIEKILRYFGNDIRHDTFKAVVYGEACAMTESEEIVKNYYDAYVYLLNNSKMVLSRDLLRKFFYIFGGVIADEALLTRISSTAFHTMNTPLIKKLVDMPIYIYKELADRPECERTMISLMFFNYYLVREGIPTIPFFKSDVREYISLRERENTEALEKFIFKIIENAKFQDKDYYENLKELDIVDIQKALLSEKDVLTNNYGIQHAYVYGSFTKGTARIDSDIDILFFFSCNLTYHEKNEIIELLSEHYFKAFNRYVDIQESGAYINNSLIKEISKYTMIF